MSLSLVSPLSLRLPMSEHSHTQAIGLTPANTAVTPVLIDIGIGRGIFMAFRAVTFLTIWKLPTLNILLMGYRFEMVRVNTPCVATKMIQRKSIRNRSYKRSVREPVSIDNFIVDSKDSIARTGNCCLPNPAARRNDFYFLLKSFMGRLARTISPRHLPSVSLENKTIKAMADMQVSDMGLSPVPGTSDS